MQSQYHLADPDHAGIRICLIKRHRSGKRRFAAQTALYFPDQDGGMHLHTERQVFGRSRGIAAVLRVQPTDRVPALSAEIHADGLVRRVVPVAVIHDDSGHLAVFVRAAERIDAVDRILGTDLLFHVGNRKCR